MLAYSGPGTLLVIYLFLMYTLLLYPFFSAEEAVSEGNYLTYGPAPKISRNKI